MAARRGIADAHPLLISKPATSQPAHSATASNNLNIVLGVSLGALALVCIVITCYLVTRLRRSDRKLDRELVGNSGSSIIEVAPQRPSFMDKTNSTDALIQIDRYQAQAGVAPLPMFQYPRAPIPPPSMPVEVTTTMAQALSPTFARARSPAIGQTVTPIMSRTLTPTMPRSLATPSPDARLSRDSDASGPVNTAQLLITSLEPRPPANRARANSDTRAPPPISPGRGVLRSPPKEPRPPSTSLFERARDSLLRARALSPPLEEESFFAGEESLPDREKTPPPMPATAPIRPKRRPSSLFPRPRSAISDYSHAAHHGADSRRHSSIASKRTPSLLRRRLAEKVGTAPPLPDHLQVETQFSQELSTQFSHESRTASPSPRTRTPSPIDADMDVPHSARLTLGLPTSITLGYNLSPDQQEMPALPTRAGSLGHPRTFRPASEYADSEYTRADRESQYTLGDYWQPEDEYEPPPLPPVPESAAHVRPDSVSTFATMVPSTAARTAVDGGAFPTSPPPLPSFRRDSLPVRGLNIPPRRASNMPARPPRSPLRGPRAKPAPLTLAPARPMSNIDLRQSVTPTVLQAFAAQLRTVPEPLATVDDVSERTVRTVRR